MTNTWVHGVEVNFCNATSVLSSECLQDPLLAKKVNPSDELAAGCGNGQQDGADLAVSLEDHVSRAEKLATWEPDCDGVSEEGSYPSVASSGSTDTDAGEWSYAEEYEHCKGHVVDLGVSGGSVASFDTGSFESCDVAEDAGPLAGSKLMPCGGGINGVDKLSYGLELQHDGGGEFFDTEESPVWARPSPRQGSPSTSPQKNARNSEGSAHVVKQRLPGGLCKDPSRPISQEMELYCSEDVVSSVHCSGNDESPLEAGESPLKRQLGSGKVGMADANGTSSSYASFLQPNEHTIKSCRRGDADAAFRDLEAGLEAGSHSLSRERRKLQERSFYDKDLVADLLTSGSLLRHASSNELGKILLSHIPEHDLNLSKSVGHPTDARTNGHAAEKEDGEVSGLRRRKSGRASADTDGAKAVQYSDDNGSFVTSFKDGLSENGHDVRKFEKKGSTKQIKARLASLEKEAAGMASVKSVSSVRRAGSEVPSPEEMRAKEQAENDRKVQESLDNFIRQTMGREPYMSFPTRADRCVPRLHRPEVIEPITGNKTGKGVKLDAGLDMRENGAEDVSGNSSDLESFRESTSGTVKTGLGRGLPISDQLPGWPLMSPSPKVQLQKCQKCSREFCSIINYRRHNRTHKKIFDADKEDWSKERPKIAAFWERLSPMDGQSLFKSLTLEDSDEYSGAKVVKALGTLIQQYSLLSLPSSYHKAGVALLAIFQMSSEDFNLPADKLFGMFDDLSEKTFLIGSTDPKDQKVFSGDEKVGLEDKNLVSFLGFLLEQKLMKAWMKDKDEQALICQKLLFAEEEAAQQKLAKTQEKKRLKKAKKGLKERERKESVIIPAETDANLLENTGMVQGEGLPEDSPRSGPSSIGSSAEMTDVGGHFYGKDDEDVSGPHADLVPSDEILEGDSIADVEAKPLATAQIFDEASGVAIGTLPASRAVERLSSRDPNLKETASGDSEITADDKGYAGEAKISSVQPDPEVGPRTHSLEPERINPDFRRREADRNFADRKFGRAARSRAEFNDGMGSSGFGNRSAADGRFWDSPGQGVFKPIRKPNTGASHSGRADSGQSQVPESAQMRVQHFRSKSGGRSTMLTGVQHGVWTVKANQPATGEQKDKKDDDDSNNENASSKTIAGQAEDSKRDEVSVTELVTPVVSYVENVEENLAVEDRREITTAAGHSEDMCSITVAPTKSVSLNLDVNPGDWPRLPQKSCNQGPSVPANEFASQAVGSGQATELYPQAVAWTGSSLLQDTASQISLGRPENKQPDVTSGELLVGSLTVPLGNFGSDSGFPPNRWSNLTESLQSSGVQQGPYGANFGSASVAEVGSRSELGGFVENAEDVGDYQKGRSHDGGNTSFKNFRHHANTAGERRENTGSESIEATSAQWEDAEEVLKSSTDGSLELFSPGPLLVVNDSVRNYVSALSEFNRTRWEEAQLDPDAWRDMEAAEYEVEETEKVDFLESVIASEKAWLKSTAGDQSQCLAEQTSVGSGDGTILQDVPEEALPDTGAGQYSGGSEGQDDGTSNSDSQQVTDLAVTSGEEQGSPIGAAAQVPTEGSDLVKEGTSVAGSGSAGVMQGRGTRQVRPPDSTGGLRYVARRR